MLLSSRAYSESSIKLPPRPKMDDPNSLLGPDVNKNLVRDDVEHFIYEEITKDPALFRSYMKSAANETRYLLAETSDDIKKEFELSLSIVVCAYKFIPNPREFIEGTRKIRGKVLNTKTRRERIDLNEGKIPTFYIVTDEERKTRHDKMKKEVCI